MNAQEMAKRVGGQLGSAIARAFDLMEIAEREIAAAKRRHPGAAKAGVLDACFLACRPPPELTHRADQVVAAHMREVLDRAAALHRARRWADKARRSDVEFFQLGTDAQVLCALSDASLKAPLGQEALGLYEQLFAEVMGPLPGEPLGRECWRGAREEMRKELQRKTADPERTMRCSGK